MSHAATNDSINSTGGVVAPKLPGGATLPFPPTPCLEYAERLKKSSVPCAPEVVPGAFHGFDLIAPTAGVSQQFFESQCAALRSAFDVSP